MEPPLAPHHTQWSDDGTAWWDGEAWIPPDQVLRRQAELEREAEDRTRQEQAGYAERYAQWQAEQVAAAGDNPFAATASAPPPPPGLMAVPQPAGPRPTGYALGWWSFAAAMFGVIAWGLGGLAAVILGHLSRKQSREARLAPNIWSRWGLFFGYLELVTLAAAIAFLVSVATDPGHSTTGQSLKVAAGAEGYYHDAYGTYARSMAELAPTRLRVAPGVEVSVVSADASTYCLRGQQGTTVLFLDSRTGDVSTHPCH